MAEYGAYALAAAVTGSSIMGGKGASRQASAEKEMYEKELDYKIWADERNAEWDRYQAYMTQAEMTNQRRDKWFNGAMDWAGLGARFGAPGKPISMPRPMPSAGYPSAPPVQTYPGYRGGGASVGGIARNMGLTAGRGGTPIPGRRM